MRKTLRLGLMLLLAAACGPAEVLSDPCTEAEAGMVHACASGAVTLILSTTQPLVADGTTPAKLEIITGNGEGDVFANVPFELTVEGAQLVAPETKKATGTTNGVGRAEFLVVFPKAGNVAFRGRTTKAGEEAETFLSLSVAPAPLRQVTIATAATRLQADTDVRLELRGFLDDALAKPARGGEVVAFCAVPATSADITAETLRLNDSGTAEVTVRPHKVPSVETVTLRACPAVSVEEGRRRCASEGDEWAAGRAGCDERHFDVDDVVRPVERVLLSAPQAFLRVNTDTIVTVHGFSDEIFQERAQSGGAVDICVLGSASLNSQVVLLDGAGNATFVVRPRAGSEGTSIRVSACPSLSAHTCDAAELNEACDRLPELGVLPAATPASFFAVGIGAAVVVEEASVPVIVAGFGDSAFAQPASPGSPALVCSDDPSVRVTPSLVFLDANGRGQATLTADRGASALSPHKVIACPALPAGCAAENAGCGTVNVSVDAVAVPALFFVLGARVAAFVEETPAPIVVGGFADETLTRQADPGQPVALCTNAPEALEVAPTVVFLDGEGRAEASILGRTDSSARSDLAVFACRPGVPCGSPACGSLPVFMTSP